MMPNNIIFNYNLTVLHMEWKSHNSLKNHCTKAVAAIYIYIYILLLFTICHAP